MARKKVNIAWIENDSSRRTTMKKRRRGLLKKVREISILCDVPACAVVYEPGNPVPEVWPKEPEARRILRRFGNMPAAERAKKMLDQEGFIRQRMAKMVEQRGRQEREMKVLKMRVLLHHAILGGSLPGLRPDEAVILERLIDEKARAVRARIQELMKAAGGQMATMMMPDVKPNVRPTFNPSVGIEEKLGLGFYRGAADGCLRPSGVISNPDIKPDPCPNTGFGIGRLGLGFYGSGGGGYLHDVIMQQPLPPPCMGMEMMPPPPPPRVGMGMMKYGGSSSWMMDHASSSSSRMGVMEYRAPPSWMTDHASSSSSGMGMGMGMAENGWSSSWMMNHASSSTSTSSPYFGF